MPLITGNLTFGHILLTEQCRDMIISHPYKNIVQVLVNYRRLGELRRISRFSSSRRRRSRQSASVK